MGNGLMWFGTFHHSEWIDCPQVGSDLNPRSWGSGGVYLSGGGFESGSPDAHKEFNLSWSAASDIPAAARMQAYRDGAYSKTPGDLFYFHDPLSHSVNVLPKRWAQPSLMARTNRSWAVSEVDGPGVRGLPITGAHIEAGFTDPIAPGLGALFVPIPPGMVLRLAVNQITGFTGSGLMRRTVSSGGTAQTVFNFSGDTPVSISNVSGSLRGLLLYFKGTFDIFGIRAALYPSAGDPPADFSSAVGPAWTWHSGMGHSGCRFAGSPTYVPTNGVSGGMASYAATLREVGDWLQ